MAGDNSKLDQDLATKQRDNIGINSISLSSADLSLMRLALEFKIRVTKNSCQKKT